MQRHRSSASRAGSPFRLAPEIEGDVADRVSNNQWQLGLIFAQMLLGTDPMEHLVHRLYGNGDSSWEDGPVLVREDVRRRFFASEMPGFEELAIDYSDVLAIVSGLLEKDPDTRWTAERAWSEAVKVAKARGIPIDGGPRVPQMLPPELFGE